MGQNLNRILLIDDNAHDNFFHARAIKMANFVGEVVVKDDPFAALEYLRADSHTPDLIFLDINMPGLNGWEFLEKYRLLDEDKKSKIMVVMLTTSGNPDDEVKANSIAEVSAFRSKPLTPEMFDEICKQFFE